MNKTAFSLLLALFFAPVLGSTQSFTVNSAFDPNNYKPLDGQQRFQRWLNEDGASSSMHLHALAMGAIIQAMDDPSQWGRTTGGYARRMRNEYAGALIANSVHENLAAAEGIDLH